MWSRKKQVHQDIESLVKIQENKLLEKICHYISWKKNPQSWTLSPLQAYFMMRGTIKSLAQIRSPAHTPSVNIWEPWTIMLTGITKMNISMVSFELFLQWWCSCMAVLILWGSCKLRHSPPPHLHTRKKIVYVCKHETICTNTAREAGGCRSSKKELTLSVSHKLVCETRLGSVWHDL